MLKLVVLALPVLILALLAHVHRIRDTLSQLIQLALMALAKATRSSQRISVLLDFRCLFFGNGLLRFAHLRGSDI